MKVAVTGADGQLGTNTVISLLNAGYQVLCFVEPGRTPFTLENLDVEIQFSDIMDTDKLSSAFSGCEVVINAAGQARYWPRMSRAVNRVNIDGAYSVASAALNARVGRFLHVGSAGSYRPGSLESPGDETSPMNISKFKVSYIDSKRKSMELVLGMHRDRGLPALVVSPTFIIGPYGGPAGSSSIVYKMQRKPVRAVPPGGRNFIHAGDVAAGIVKALELGRDGESYILGNQNLNYLELISLISEVAGTDPPVKVSSGFLAKSAGHLATAADLIKGRRPSFTYAVARLMCEDYYYSSSKAVSELNLPRTPIKTAIKDALEWYKSIGLAE